jgi:hypothetical protein
MVTAIHGIRTVETLRKYCHIDDPDELNASLMDPVITKIWLSLTYDLFREKLCGSRKQSSRLQRRTGDEESSGSQVSVPLWKKYVCPSSI